MERRHRLSTGFPHPGDLAVPRPGLGAWVLVASFLVPAAVTPQVPAPEFESLLLTPQPWEEIRKITADTDRFGLVVLHGDNLVVGLPSADDAGAESGAVSVLERHKGGTDTWGLVKRLTASDGAPYDHFGLSVALDGDTLVVGASPYDGPVLKAGLVYVFERNRGGSDNWGEVKKLLPSDAESFGYFGSSVAVSGDTVVVGAFNYGLQAGAAYVFERHLGGTDNWGEKRLRPHGVGDFDEFGFSVTISGDTVVVGATDDAAPEVHSGSAYVFERNQGGAGNWGMVKRLSASDGVQHGHFGTSVSLSGDTLAVGRVREGASPPGSVYVFERDQGGVEGWGEVRKLTASDSVDSTQFGRSLSLRGDTLAVGVYSDEDAGSESGSAYVFERHQGGTESWGEVRKLTASDAAAFDRFGASVTLFGNTLIIGSAYDGGEDGKKLDGLGSVYIFQDLYLFGDGFESGDTSAWSAAPGETAFY